MKSRLAIGERKGGVGRISRLYVAVPLAIPLILAAAGTTKLPRATETFAATAVSLPRIDLQALTTPRNASLPPHSLYLAVDEGDTLETIFIAGGLSRKEAATLTLKFSETVDPRRLRIGDMVRFHYDGRGEVDALEMKVTGWGALRSTRGPGGFEVAAQAAPALTVQQVISATIDSSLYEALRQNGGSPQLVQDLVDVFQWDIDFFALQKGDHFSLAVESYYRGEDHVGYGPILAARFAHKGRAFEAFRYENAEGLPGYYTANGTPVRKQFLKSPLKYTRITSGFSRKRFHPLLHRFRPHWGVDYGAPTGTPVMSTADGIVTFKGYHSGEGNMVRIKHNSRMETSYLHLSRFGKGIRKGSKVAQGDLIGYVGSTGMSTGPHLDYRVSDAGRWLNPLELKSITPDPLRGAHLRGFRAQVAHFNPRITASTTQVAQRARGERALF